MGGTFMHLLTGDFAAVKFTTTTSSIRLLQWSLIRWPMKIGLGVWRIAVQTVLTCSSLYRKQQTAMARTVVAMLKKNLSSVSRTRKLRMVSGTPAVSRLRYRSTSIGGIPVSVLGVASWIVWWPCSISTTTASQVLNILAKNLSCSVRWRKWSLVSP